MARSKTTTKKQEAAPAPKLSAVQAVFDPAGDIHCRVVAPSGNVYNVKPREAFKIEAEDVDWFFHEWDWQHRQRLSLKSEYQPRRAQFENGKASREAGHVHYAEPPQFDNGEANERARPRMPVLPPPPAPGMLHTFVGAQPATETKTDEDKE